MKKYLCAPFTKRHAYLAVLGAFLSGTAGATCTTVGTATTCDSNGVQTTTVGSGLASPAGSSVVVGTNAQISTGDANAISLGINANIAVLSGAVVQNNAVSSLGLYNTGANTIEFDSNGTLTIAPGAQVLSTGTQLKGEAINVQGMGTVIVNNGEVRAAHAAAIWFEDGPGLNTVVNNATGVIATGVAGGDVIGTSGGSSIDFTNKGTIIGNLIFANGDDTLRLYTGSSITGSIGGGGGNNLLTLNGSGYATLSDTITNFQTLTKQDDGTWVLNGAFTGLATVNANQGTLVVGDADHAGHAIGATFNVAGGATLGGYGEADGTVNNRGTIAVANAIGAFAGGANGNFTVNGTLNNAGLIRIGGSGVGNTLTVSGGGYVGQNGAIALNTVLGGDGSRSDRLILNGVAASGNTTLRITNTGGTGATTTGSGILVVNAVNGGTTAANAFSLAAPVSVGAYTYRLFKGGATADTAENWYLRSGLLSVDAAGNVTSTPLYRMETPLYAAAPAVVRMLGFRQLGSFHLRQGDQSLLGGNADHGDGWARVWGEQLKLERDSVVKPSFSGSAMGMQTGRDLYADKAQGGGNHLGLFFSYAHAHGTVKGNANGDDNIRVGSLATDAYGVGGYWSHIGAGGWYTDAVLSGNALSLNTRSDTPVASTTHGWALAASLEAGLPVALGSALSIEPQAQVVWQRQRIGDINDGVGNVKFRPDNSALGRVGVRVQGLSDGKLATWHPFLRADVLRAVSHTDNVVYDQTTTITASGNTTFGQVSTGFLMGFSKAGSVYASVGKSFDLSGSKYSATGANIGVRWAW